MDLAADVPNVADWTAAIGQAAGALFTAAAVIVALWLGRRDRRWRREEQADRDAAQARMITVEPVYDSMDWSDSVIMAKVHNNSIGPLLDVHVREVWADGHRGHRWQADFGPFDPWPETARVVMAGKTWRLPFAYIDENDRNVVVGGEDHITIGFTDANGLRWTRTDNEPPQRLVDPVPAPVARPRRFRLRLPWTWT